MKRKSKTSTKKMELNKTLKTTQTSEPTSPETVTPIVPVETPKSEPKILIIAEIVLLLVLGILGTIWFKKSLTAKAPSPTTESVPTTAKLSPSPIPLKAGSEVYSVSQSTRTGPAITTVTMDPLDVLKGQTLTVIADVNDDSDVTAVTGSLEMDSSKVDLVFKKEAGTLRSGSWKTEVKLTDSVFYIYTLTINATSKNGVNTIKVTPR